MQYSISHGIIILLINEIHRSSKLMPKKKKKKKKKKLGTLHGTWLPKANRGFWFQSIKSWDKIGHYWDLLIHSSISRKQLVACNKAVSLALPLYSSRYTLPLTTVGTTHVSKEIVLGCVVGAVPRLQFVHQLSTGASLLFNFWCRLKRQFDRILFLEMEQLDHINDGVATSLLGFGISSFLLCYSCPYFSS